MLPTAYAKLIGRKQGTPMHISIRPRILLLLAVSMATLLAIATPAVVRADVQDFTFTSFSADYYLSKDAEGRSVLKTTEKLVAEFPDFDQNHGIERAIPQEYDGHTVNLEQISVKDAAGAALPYTTYDSGNNLVLRIGSADTYVRGTQTYVISYTAHDVTKNFDEGDEFHWDTNGTQWPQSFGALTARIHIAPNLASKLDGRLKCFNGITGSTSSDCTISSSETPDETIITTTSTQPLGAYENISMVVGFNPGTFNPYVAKPMSPLVKILAVTTGIGIFAWYIIVPLLLIRWAYKNWGEHGRDSAGRGTIIPQYLPPKDVSMVRADVVIHESMQPKAISATIVDLAVRHYLKIYDTGDKSYELEIIAPTDGLQPEERSVIAMLFGGTGNVGDKTTLDATRTLYDNMVSLKTEAYDSAVSLGYMADTRSIQKRMYIFGGLVTGLSIFSFSLFGTISGVIALIYASKMPARTPKGVELKEYLDGTKMYMQVAEAERFKRMQGTETSERVDVSDTTQLIKVYERLLPLAMLYGIEKSWINEFSQLYQAQQPDWYAGNYSAFNAAAFASSMNSFTTNSMSSFAPPASSSSSGFSTGGGGGSGGGGGGGGGGGW